MTAPTALVLGDGAEAMARRALRGAGPGALLLVWRPATRSDVDGVPPAPAEQWERAPRGGAPRVVRIDRTPGSAARVLEVLGEHAVPVAIAAPGLRDDEIDRAAVGVDEVIALAPLDPAYREALRGELAPLARALTLVDEPQPAWWSRAGRGDRGQSTITVIAILAGVMAVAVALGLVASALGRSAGVQGRADVAALAGAAALRDAQALLYSADPRQRISVAEVRARAIRAARGTAQANHLIAERVGFEGAADLPTRVTVAALTTGPRAGDRRRRLTATAEVAVGAGLPVNAAAGDYAGPLAVRQGQRMRPDVATAFDRLNAAASAAGHPLVIVSAFRSDTEQAALFRAHPDPKWVAPPGKSLHRLGTELDLGPSSAYGWLAANAKRFGFIQRYSWEAWHYGFTESPGSASVGYRAASTGGGERATGAVPSFVPAQYAGLIAKAAQRWSVGAALLGAQLYQESKFNPRAVSPVGAAGIAQFMPATASAYGLSPAERFDPAKAIDAQAHLMHDLLRQFAAVPLALAAYNAGPAPVQRCGCVPGIPETQGYVQSILALLGGAGIAAPNGLDIRLVA